MEFLVVSCDRILQRNYEIYYCIDFDGISFQDYYIYLHFNGLCIVGLAPSHPIRKEKLAIKQIIFFQNSKSHKNKKRGKVMKVVSHFKQNFFKKMIL